MLRNAKLDKCLDSTNNHENGSKSIMHPCNPNNPNQLWEAIAKGNNQFMLRRSSTNQCLSAPNDHSNGQHTWLWECVGNGNQVFGSVYVAPAGGSNSPTTTSPAPGLTLIRTGGDGNIVQAAINGAARGVVNGLVQTNEGLVPILHVIAQYQEYYVNAERAKQSPDYREVQIDSPVFGKKIVYTADWGYYVRLEGEQIQSMANKLKREAPKAAWVYGTTVTTLLGLTRNKYAIALIPTAAPAAGIQGADNVQALVDEIEACGRTTKVAFVRLKLLSGSWENSKRLNLVSPFYAGALDTEISSY